MRGFDLHPETEIDLDAIWEFIAEDSYVAADRMIDAIEATIEALVPFPYQGQRRHDLTSRPLRFTNGGNYLIAHAPNQERVGCRGHAWTPQPSCDGCDSERPRVSPAESFGGQKLAVPSFEGCCVGFGCRFGSLSNFRFSKPRR